MKMKSDREKSTKRLPVRLLEEAARKATRELIERYIEENPDKKSELDSLILSGRLGKGTIFSEKFAVFELYIAGVNPNEALIFTRSQIEKNSGVVGRKEIYYPLASAASIDE